jgi:hypothetical protein
LLVLKTSFPRGTPKANFQRESKCYKSRREVNLPSSKNICPGKPILASGSHLN